MRAEHLWATPEPLPPVPGLIVADEKWEVSDKMPHCPHQRAAASLCSISPSPAERLADQLRSAVAQHPGVQQAAGP